MSAYIVAAVRTAGGKRAGALSGWHPAELGAQVLNSLVNTTKVDPNLIDDVIMGSVGQAGQQASNVARNAILSSNLPQSVPGTSVDRQCGSSQQAIHFAAQAVMSGTNNIVIACGVESMSQVTMGLPSILPNQHGYGSPNSPAMLKRYNVQNFSQFVGAEMVAKRFGLSREDLDRFSYRSHALAKTATESGAFRNEIVAIGTKTYDPKTKVYTESLDKLHNVDEGIRFDASYESISKAKLLQEGGVITAANASQICDGASGVLIVNDVGLKLLGANVKPLARIHHMSMFGSDPVIMLDAPFEGTARALKKANKSINDIDLYEINEAFASVPLAWLKHVNADPNKLNVNGGASKYDCVCIVND